MHQIRFLADHTIDQWGYYMKQELSFHPTSSLSLSVKPPATMHIDTFMAARVSERNDEGKTNEVPLKKIAMWEVLHKLRHVSLAPNASGFAFSVQKGEWQHS